MVAVVILIELHPSVVIFHGVVESSGFFFQKIILILNIPVVIVFRRLWRVNAKRDIGFCGFETGVFFRIYSRISHAVLFFISIFKKLNISLVAMEGDRLLVIITIQPLIGLIIIGTGVAAFLNSINELRVNFRPQVLTMVLGCLILNDFLLPINHLF